jgi:NCS1 family nucleobase:cation symporter-1
MLSGVTRAQADTAPTASYRSLVPWVTAMVGYWATLSLNIPDFTRYARSQRDQMIGQALGLLTTMPFIAFVGVAVTGATVIKYGEPIWNPVDLLARLTQETGNAAIGLISTVAILVATLTTNIAANIVSPANSFANLAPQRITFRRGGLIAGLIGILIVPWALLDQYQTWLLTYSGLLGAVGGVLVADYLVVRRGTLFVDDLYRLDGRYAYLGGINAAAMQALGVGVTVPLIGAIVPGVGFLFDGAWFSGAFASALTYLVLMRRAASGAPHVQETVA